MYFSKAREDLDARIEKEGFAMIPAVIADDEVELLREDLAARRDERFTRLRRGCAFAIRNLLAASPKTREIAEGDTLLSLAGVVLGEKARPVWGVLFDKIPAANWKVPWHQDLTITAERPLRVPGFGPWTEKLGVPHVQAPIEILEQMVTLRLHLDDCDGSSGALRVVPRTHVHGRLSTERIREICGDDEGEVMNARAGDVLMMSPLLLHASSPAQEPSHRRVVHLEYAACDLPGGLEWYEDHINKAASP